MCVGGGGFGNVAVAIMLYVSTLKHMEVWGHATPEFF